MEKKKIQWHPGFVAAMNLELAENRDDLIFEKEHNLNTKPLSIDLLVIKKEKSVRIINEIGSFFRGHNILEYKSPDDELDIDVFYKTGAYASLYKSYGKKLDEVKADDLTVSMLRERKPIKLFRYFQEHGYQVSNPYRGIYYVENNVLFPTQIIVTKELERKQHVWLMALSEQLQKQELRELIKSVSDLTEKADKEYADSVLQVSIGANKEIMEELMGDDDMCEALMELMEPQIALREKKIREESLQQGVQQGIQQGVRQGIQQGIQQGVQQGIQQGIQQGVQQGIQQGIQQGVRQGIRATVEALRKFGCTAIDIQKAIMEQYGLTEDAAKKYI